MKVKVRIETLCYSDNRFRFVVLGKPGAFGYTFGSRAEARKDFKNFARRMGIPPDKYEIVEE